MSLQNLKMKSRNPQQKGNVRGGADAEYIPGIGSQPNSGSHGSASGPYRMVPSKKSPLGPGPSNKPMSHGNKERMERYNTENQRSRERGECIPSNLYSKKSNSPETRAALASHNSAPYGRSRSADSSRSYATPGAPTITKGAGRARGVNIWFPNKGIAASGDSGESQRSSKEE